MKVRIHVHLEGLTGFDPVLPPWDLPKFRLGDFEVGPLEPPQMPRLARTSALYVASTELDIGEAKVVNPPAVYAAVDALITCLRLFKPGYVGANPILMETPAADGGWQRAPLEEGRSARDQQGGLAYPLTSEQIPRLVEFAKVIPLISSGPATSRTSPAFQFFNRGVDDEARNAWPLAIVDFVSCMEALLLSGSSELSHRLSESVSLVTERSAEKRQTRYAKCRELYRMRSKAIHGEHVDGAMETAPLAESLARYCTRVFLGYRSAGLGKSELVDDIESILLGQRREFPEHAFSFVKGLPIPQPRM
jgi:hypothetical protein